MKKELSRRFGDRFEYATARNGHDALATADRLVADGRKLVLVLSDLLMPGMKGDEFLVELHKRHPAVATALISGGCTRDESERLKDDAGLVANLGKPWTANEICSVVERFVTAKN